MPINKEVQEKVLKIAASKAVNETTKLAVRKQFYVLKNEEIDFDIKVAEFSAILDNVLVAVSEAELKTAVPVRPIVSVPKQVAQNAVFEDIVTDEPEEIIIPQKQPNISAAGVKVRMQESVDAEEETTDFEVPFEADEK